MNFLVNFMIICALSANLFPPLISGSLIKNKIKEGKKILDNAAEKLIADGALKRKGFPEKGEITEHVCHNYEGMHRLYGDIVCHNAYETHFKSSKRFKNAKLTKKAECMEITYGKKTADMVVCGYTSEEYPNARFLVTNAPKEKTKSYYHFETENIIKKPKPNLKFVHLRSIYSKNWEISLNEVRADDHQDTMAQIKIAAKHLMTMKVDEEDAAGFAQFRKEEILKKKNKDA